MADVMDVCAALAQRVGSTLYPTGGSGASPVAGVPVLVQVGWPDPASLETQVKGGKAQVTVFPHPSERNTTRFTPEESGPATLPAATYSLTASGQTVTVAGAQASFVQNVCAFVNGTPYITPGVGTPTQIAAALATLIAAAVPGTSSAGAVITLPASARIGALRVGVSTSTLTEVRRQERRFQIVVWAPTPAARDAIAAPVDVALAQTQFLTLADATMARLIYQQSLVVDTDQLRGIYRRDLVYSAEYATTAAGTSYQIVSATLDLEDPTGALILTKTA